MLGRMLSGLLPLCLIVRFFKLPHPDMAGVSLAWSFVLFFIEINYCAILCRAIDHQWTGNLFATAGAQVDIWDQNRFAFPFTFLFEVTCFQPYSLT